jgi:ubiquinone/menaquinone biosynthesis C-methylase UbiE
MKTPEQIVEYNTKMEQSKMSSTQNYYDGIAKGYSELYHEEQEEKISLIKSSLPKEGALLDLGAGAGVLNPFLSPSLSLVTSFDLSQELLNINSNKKEHKIQGDICNLPFENNSYDTICSFTVIQDVYNIEKAFEEIQRVLKPQGALIISFLKRSKNKELIETIIGKNFNIEKEIEEFKDMIFVLTKVDQK